MIKSIIDFKENKNFEEMFSVLRVCVGADFNLNSVIENMKTFETEHHITGAKSIKILHYRTNLLNC